MKCVRFHEYGDPEVLKVEDIEEPTPSPGKVLIKVKAVGLNHLDLWVRKGLPGIKSVMPHIGGSDFTGEIVALGDGVNDLEIGQSVIDFPLESYGGVPFYLCDNPPKGTFEIIGEQSNGACCEFINVNRPNILPLPETLTFEEGAAIPIVFITAWRMLTERAKLEMGETLLVQGAGSGVGSAAIQIGKLIGAKVIACTSTDKKAKQALDLGADEIINYKNESISERVKEITKKNGVDVVLEHVGDATWKESIKSAAYHGRIVTCGATTGFKGETNLALLFAKQLSVLGSTMGTLPSFKKLLSFFEQGKLRPVIDRIMKLEECKEAHEILEEGKQFGKIVLQVNN